eukprot:GDKK01065028.1.p1 GENE.GDKK01065028.1~~GDKK01065028.1.p1  ORF type:complete len:422 (+),score=106.53 GDKK01065028.1:136-1266(+)
MDALINSLQTHAEEKRVLKEILERRDEEIKEEIQMIIDDFEKRIAEVRLVEAQRLHDKEKEINEVMLLKKQEADAILEKSLEEIARLQRELTEKAILDQENLSQHQLVSRIEVDSLNDRIVAVVAENEAMSALNKHYLERIRSLESTSLQNENKSSPSPFSELVVSDLQMIAPVTENEEALSIKHPLSPQTTSSAISILSPRRKVLQSPQNSNVISGSHKKRLLFSSNSPRSSQSSPTRNKRDGSSSSSPTVMMSEGRFASSEILENFLFDEVNNLDCCFSQSLINEFSNENLEKSDSRLDSHDSQFFSSSPEEKAPEPKPIENKNTREEVPMISLRSESSRCQHHHSSLLIEDDSQTKNVACDFEAHSSSTVITK